MLFGLKNEVIEAATAVFSRYKQIEKVVLFGSRAKGNYKNGSDIDIAISGMELQLNDQLRMMNELEELEMPYTFDVAFLHHISNPALLEHIKRIGIVIYDSNK